MDTHDRRLPRYDGINNVRVRQTNRPMAIITRNRILQHNIRYYLKTNVPCVRYIFIYIRVGIYLDQDENVKISFFFFIIIINVIRPIILGTEEVFRPVPHFFAVSVRDVLFDKHGNFEGNNNKNV